MRSVIRSGIDTNVQTLIAAGDVCLAGDVRKLIEGKGLPYIFDPVSSWLATAEYRFANLECCLIPIGEDFDEQRLDMRADAGVAPALASFFNVVSVANNHSCDYGRKIFINMLQVLEANGIAPIGGGKSRTEAGKAKIISQKGISTAWLAYADWEYGGAVFNASGKNRPGVAILSEHRVRRAVAELTDRADVIIVSLHTDLEFTDDPDPARIRLCRTLAEIGADVILCHHPHVPQGVEVYNNTLIAYGLGNCVFPVRGNCYMEKNSIHTNHSFALKVNFDKQGVVDYELLPFALDEENRPIPLCGQSEGQFLSHIAVLSNRLKDKDEIAKRWSGFCYSFVLKHLVAQYYLVRACELRGVLRFLRYLPHRIFRRAIAGFISHWVLLVKRIVAVC